MLLLIFILVVAVVWPMAFTIAPIGHHHQLVAMLPYALLLLQVCVYL